MLVQDRAAVCDPPRWRDFVSTVAAELGEAAHAFQVGQAPNRKKWGVWHPDEYVRLLEGVQEARAAWPRCRWLGPAVIDFEYHFTVNFLFRPRPFDFDGIASLLYVDRRGSPESTQYGHFDLGRKILLLRAVIETAPHPVVPIHLTEFNWPLRDTGRFSPAGRHVQVDEDDQAAYLVLYYLASAASGCVASAFWWQLVAHGYGLVDDEGDVWRHSSRLHGAGGAAGPDPRAHRCAPPRGRSPGARLRAERWRGRRDRLCHARSGSGGRAAADDRRLGPRGSRAGSSPARARTSAVLSPDSSTSGSEETLAALAALG